MASTTSPHRINLLSVSAIAVASLVTLLLLIANINLCRPPVSTNATGVDSRILSQLAYLDFCVAHDGPARMQALYPEGAFFMHMLHTLSWIQVARRVPVESELRRAAVGKGMAGLRAMELDLDAFPEVRALSPPNGAFFGGWVNWTRGALLSLRVRDTVMVGVETDFKHSCELIGAAYDSSCTPFLDSYQGMCWPSDNVVAVASLRMYDHLFGERYDATIRRWVSLTKGRLDPVTGMVPYQTVSGTGACLEGAEGNTEAIIIRFLAELDPAFATEQYVRYCRSFPATRLGLHLVREYPAGKRGRGNIDSGPVIWGIGSAATIVAPVAMRLFGDFERTTRVEQSIDALGFPMSWDGRTRYALGLMPVADAFLVWSKLECCYTQDVPVVKESQPERWWRTPFCSISLVLCTSAWGAAAVLLGGSRRRSAQSVRHRGPVEK
jgi:hypothetical protein